MTKNPTARDIVAKLESVAAASSGKKDELAVIAAQVSQWGENHPQLGRNPAEFSTAVKNYNKATHRADWQRVQAAATRLLPLFRKLGDTHLP